MGNPGKKRKRAPGNRRKGPIPIQRDDWRKRLDERNPDIQQLRQSIDPWERFLSFVEVYEPGRERVKQQLSNDLIVKLIMQHLTYYGFHSVRDTLAKESGIDLEQEEEEAFTESRLLYFIRSALRDTEQIYNLTLDESLTASKAEVELEELLCNYELIEAEPMFTGSENINIWDEPEDNTIVWDEEKQVKMASLNKLVELISCNTTEMVLVNMFLITYQSFTTPEILFSKLMERWNVPDRIPPADATIIRMKVGNVLRKWIEGSYNDFSPDLILRLDQFMKQLEYQENKALVSLGKTLRNGVTKADSLKMETNIVRQFNKATPAPKINMKTIFAPENQLDIFSLPGEEIARQLCIIEFRLFSKIRPSEFLNQSWSKPKYKHRAMNILRMISRFNTVSMWVVTSILKVPKVRARAKLMEKFIKIAQHLLNMHNFNGTMAIIAGLNWSSVHRLTWTRRELSPAVMRTLEDMERILSSDRSFLTYRTHIAECNPPCIPYLGVYLTDLTFIDENADTVNGLINFAKRKMIYNVISKIIQYQQTHYNLQPVEQIIQQLQKVVILDETTLYNLSLKREPRKAERHEIE